MEHRKQTIASTMTEVQDAQEELRDIFQRRLMISPDDGKSGLKKRTSVSEDFKHSDATVVRSKSDPEKIRKHASVLVKLKGSDKKNKNQEAAIIKSKDPTPPVPAPQSPVSEKDSPDRYSIFSQNNFSGLVPVTLVLANKGGPSAKCSWLRSQILGRDVEFSTPFGRRLMTCADHKRQSLWHIESFILQKILPFYGDTEMNDNFVGTSSALMVHESALYIKHCLGATNEEVLFFCGSGSICALGKLQEVLGVTVPDNLRQQVLEDLPWEKRWVVFTGPYEHHANLHSWNQSLVELVRIPVNPEGFLDLACLGAALRDPNFYGRPKLGFFSACSSVTGILTDTRAVARILHENGAFACFDFSTCAPSTQINMRGDNPWEAYDAIVLSPHRIVGGEGSPGLLVINRHLYILTRQNSPSGYGEEAMNPFVQGTQLCHIEVEAHESLKKPPNIPKIRAALSFWVKEQMGTDLIQSCESFFLQTALQRFRNNPCIRIIGNTTVKRAAILSFMVYSVQVETSLGSAQSMAIPKLNNMGSASREFVGTMTLTRRGKPLHGRFIVKLLNDLFGIQARCQCLQEQVHGVIKDGRATNLLTAGHDQGWTQTAGWVRISFAYYSSTEEFAFILAAVEFISKYGQRFLTLYDFDWDTGEWNFRELMKNFHLKNLWPWYASCHRGKDVRDFHEFLMLSEPSKQEDQGHSDNMSFNEKYERYMQISRRIADLLPKCPAEREIPGYVNPDHVGFRV